MFLTFWIFDFDTISGRPSVLSPQHQLPPKAGRRLTVSPSWAAIIRPESVSPTAPIPAWPDPGPAR